MMHAGAVGRMACWSALIAVLVTSTGCQTVRGWFGSGDEKKKEEKPAELVKFDPEVRVRRLWQAKVGSGAGEVFTKLHPTLAAGYVIAADGFGVVEARDRRTGKRAWRVSIGRIERGLSESVQFWKGKQRAFVSGGLGGNDDLVVLGTERGEVVALNSATGAEVWRTQVSSEVLAAPAVGERVVALQTIDGKLVALDRGSGERLWSYDTQVPVLTLRGTSSPVISNGFIIAGFANGRLAMLNAEQGNVIWEQRVMLPQGRSELERIVDVDSTPLVADGVVYAASFQGRIKALRQRDGRTIWERDVSTYQPLAHGFGFIYVVDEFDQLIAIDEGSGVDVWEQKALRLRGASAPVVFSNYVAVGDGKGYLHVFAQSDGRPVGRRRIGGDGIIGELLESEGMVYGQTRDGHLFAVQVERR